MYVGKYGRYYSSIESQLGGYAEWAPLANTHDVVFAELATFLLEFAQMHCQTSIHLKQISIHTGAVTHSSALIIFSNTLLD